MQETKRIVFEINVYVFGVKRKCRKSEKHSFKLGSIDYNEGAFSRDDIEQRARDIVATNMKAVEGQYITVQMLRVEKSSENGFTSTSFQMFDDRHVNFQIPSSKLVGALV
jgi:hypothetical protein